MRARGGGGGLTVPTCSPFARGPKTSSTKKKQFKMHFKFVKINAVALPCCA